MPVEQAEGLPLTAVLQQKPFEQVGGWRAGGRLVGQGWGRWWGGRQAAELPLGASPLPAEADRHADPFMPCPLTRPQEGEQPVQPGPTAADKAAEQQAEQEQQQEAAAAAEAAAEEASADEGGRPLSAELAEPLAQQPPPKRRRHEREAPPPAEDGPTPAPGARRSSRPASAASAERPGSAAGGREGARAGSKREVHGR